MSERLSQRFERMRRACEGGRVTLRALLPGLGARDHGLLLLLIAVCFMHPFPMPGLSWILGVLVVVAGARMIFGQGLWLPASALDKPVPGGVLAKLFGWAAAFFRKTEGFIRPRGRWLADHPWALRVTGVAILLCGLMLLVPIPPPTNYPPATALLLISLGLLESDLLFLVLGHVGTVAGLAFFGSIAFYGLTGLHALIAKL